jgi:NADH-quinone oxidoreductase subunit J
VSLTFIFFAVLSILAIASGVVTISSKNPVVSAMALVVQFFMLAGLYLTLNAQFIAVIQVLVYAGAIMVLVVFVIMLLNLGDEEKLKENFNIRVGIAIAFSAVLLLQFIVIFLSQSSIYQGFAPNSITQGTVEGIGQELYKNYLLPFIAISIVLVAAIIGAVILAKRKLD